MKIKLKERFKQKAEKRAQKLMLKKIEEKTRAEFVESCNWYMVVNNCTFKEAYDHLINVLK